LPMNFVGIADVPAERLQNRLDKGGLRVLLAQSTVPVSTDPRHRFPDDRLKTSALVIAHNPPFLPCRIRRPSAPARTRRRAGLLYRAAAIGNPGQKSEYSPGSPPASAALARATGATSYFLRFCFGALGFPSWGGCPPPGLAA